MIAAGVGIVVGCCAVIVIDALVIHNGIFALLGSLGCIVGVLVFLLGIPPRTIRIYYYDDGDEEH